MATSTDTHSSGTTLPLPGNSGGASQIAAELRRGILEGSYTFGTRLPPERELAVHYGTSRSTIREALRRLGELKLVTPRVGSGTFVSYREYADQVEIADITSPLELIDVRFAVEPQMARLAVLNASVRDLNRLANALSAVEACRDNPETFSRRDEDFHLALAEATQNPLMLRVYKQINEVRGHAQWDARKDKILSPENMARYNAQHRRLFIALRSRDVDHAVATITEHLQQARRDLLGSADT